MPPRGPLASAASTPTRRRRAACAHQCGPSCAIPPSPQPSSWPLRASDIDLHGHANNTVYWQAIEHLLLSTGLDVRRPFRARLEFREPLDLGDELELAVTGDGSHLGIAFVADGRVKAVGEIGELTAASR
jgi:hypothetical protein